MQRDASAYVLLLDDVSEALFDLTEAKQEVRWRECCLEQVRQDSSSRSSGLNKDIDSELHSHEGHLEQARQYAAARASELNKAIDRAVHAGINARLIAEASAMSVVAVRQRVNQNDRPLR